MRSSVPPKASIVHYTASEVGRLCTSAMLVIKNVTEISRDKIIKLSLHVSTIQFVRTRDVEVNSHALLSWALDGGEPHGVVVFLTRGKILLYRLNRRLGGTSFGKNKISWPY